MVVGETNDRAYIASEECAIRAVEPDISDIRSPKGGEPVIFRVKGGD
jgi:glutamate synthase domain-containing protein 1